VLPQSGFCDRGLIVKGVNCPCWTISSPQLTHHSDWQSVDEITQFPATVNNLTCSGARAGDQCGYRRLQNVVNKIEITDSESRESSYSIPSDSSSVSRRPRRIIVPVIALRKDFDPLSTTKHWPRLVLSMRCWRTAFCRVTFLSRRSRVVLNSFLRQPFSVSTNVTSALEVF